jgi:hypothetical protein
VLEEEVKEKPIETAKTKLSKTNKDEVEAKPVQTIEFARHDPVHKCYIISKECYEDWDGDEDSGEESKPESVLTNDMSGVSLLLNNLIKDEFDAIDQYNSAITTLQSEGLAEDILGILYDVVAEENTHVGQLQKALELINPTAVENIKDGEQEAEGQINKE